VILWKKIRSKKRLLSYAGKKGNVTLRSFKAINGAINGVTIRQLVRVTEVSMFTIEKA